MPSKSGTTQMKCIYEGSVKRVWQPANKPDRLWFEFTDDYSVFDWGKMPDTIANKGKALTAFGAHFFDALSQPKFWQSVTNHKSLSNLDQDWWQERQANNVFRSLQEVGLATHYCGLVDEHGDELPLSKLPETPRAFLEVQKAYVPKVVPANVSGQTVYYYPQDSLQHKVRLVPLEVVFRFGMPSGSSLKSRLEKNPGYAQQLGLKKVPAEGQWFDRPVLEFFTKLEPKDRLLTLQEAITISTLTIEQFQQLTELATAAALGLFVQFAERGIELWDGKFEFIVNDNLLLLADSIGPDELRLLYKDAHLSKEFIRQIYRGTPWEKAINESQKVAIARGAHDWKSICSDELQQQPAPLPPAAKSLADALYPALANHIIGEAIFVGQPTLETLGKNLLSHRQE